MPSTAADQVFTSSSQGWRRWCKLSANYQYDVGICLRYVILWLYWDMEPPQYWQSLRPLPYALGAVVPVAPFRDGSMQDPNGNWVQVGEVRVWVAPSWGCTRLRSYERPKRPHLVLGQKGSLGPLAMEALSLRMKFAEAGEAKALLCLGFQNCSTP